MSREREEEAQSEEAQLPLPLSLFVNKSPRRLMNREKRTGTGYRLPRVSVKTHAQYNEDVSLMTSLNERTAVDLYARTICHFLSRR